MICKQLGYDNALAYIESSHKGKHLGFVMFLVECYPDETLVDIPGYPPDKIQDCSYQAMNTSCSASIAGTLCQSKNENVNHQILFS